MSGGEGESEGDVYVDGSGRLWEGWDCFSSFVDCGRRVAFRME